MLIVINRQATKFKRGAGALVAKEYRHQQEYSAIRFMIGNLQTTDTKTPQLMLRRGNKAWRCPTLTWGSPTLPSALLRFTSEFGMESGGSTMLWSPNKILFGCTLLCKMTLNTGADTQTRTGDLILTKDALYHLSYISIVVCP